MLSLEWNRGSGEGWLSDELSAQRDRENWNNWFLPTLLGRGKQGTKNKERRVKGRGYHRLCQLMMKRGIERDIYIFQNKVEQSNRHYVGTVCVFLHKGCGGKERQQQYEGISSEFVRDATTTCIRAC